jgi:hypothetical protein
MTGGLLSAQAQDSEKPRMFKSETWNREGARNIERLGERRGG